MVEMTVAHDERIDLRCIDLEQIHIAVDGLRRPTEIQQEGALFHRRAAAPEATPVPISLCSGRVVSADRPGSVLTPPAACGLKKTSVALSTSTRTLSLSIVGTSIGLPWPSRYRKTHRLRQPARNWRQSSRHRVD